VEPVTKAWTFQSGAKPPEDASAPQPAVAPWPAPLGSAALHGSIGDFIRVIDPVTEADPAALVFEFLGQFGSAIGRGPYYQVEATRHHTNLDIAIVGKTSKARKGTAHDRVRQLLVMLDPKWAEECQLLGLVSGEAALDEMGAMEEKTDKRGLLLETEFARLIKIIAREGSTLSTVIRQAWDTGDLAITRAHGNKKQVHGAHISAIGHITKEELTKHLVETELLNGFGNRYLWVCVRRSKVLSRSRSTPDLTPLLTRLREATDFARRQGNTRYDWDDDAAKEWDLIYEELSAARPGLSGAATSRGEAQVPRIALQYALLDKADKLCLRHLRAALEVWRYALESARYIWGDGIGDPVADTILEALKKADGAGMTRTEIHVLFANNQKAARLDMALRSLAEYGRARFEMQPDGGRPVERWFHIGAGFNARSAA
jgi:hypothetical protein